MPKISPFATVKLMPRTACVGPSSLCRSLTRIAGGESLRACMKLLVPRVSGPGVSLNQNLAIRGHAGFGVTETALELQLQTDDLLHAFVAKVTVLRCERCFRIDARNDRFEWFVRVRIEIDARRLVQLYLADLTFGHKAAQIDFVQIEQRYNRCSGRDHFAGFGSSRRNRASERRSNVQVLAIRLCFRQLRASLIELGVGARNFLLLLRDLPAICARLTGANAGVLETCSGHDQRSARGFHSTSCGRYCGVLLLRSRNRFFAFAIRNWAGRGGSRVPPAREGPGSRYAASCRASSASAA